MSHLQLAQFGLDAQRSGHVLINLDDPIRPLTLRVLTEALASWATGRRQSAEKIGDANQAESLLAEAREADRLMHDLKAATEGEH